MSTDDGSGGRGAQGTATAGVTRWLTIHDELLRGVAHALSNRLGTLAALTGILEAGIMPDPRLVGGLSADGAQLEGLLQVLRQLPGADDPSVEPMLLGDAVDAARHLVAEHPAFRGRGRRVADEHGVAGDGTREVQVVLLSDVPPVRANPNAVAHAVVVALLAAARRGGDAVRVTLDVQGDLVHLLAHVASANDASEADTEADAADLAALTWLLAGSSGVAIHEGPALGFTLPTLAASRRPRG